VESTEEIRRNYREMLFRTARVEEFISGVILFDETIRHNAADGTPLVKVLSDRGIIPGIKVDTGAVPLPEAPDELVTEGLDGLRNRLKEYEELGAGFTKWRAVIGISDNTPTSYGLNTNAHALARFAALSQEAGLVPIVEPEILRDGDHDIDRCFEVTEETLREVFDQLAQQKVLLEGMLLKPSMVISGGSAGQRADPDEVAERTIECFKRALPASVPGVVFLSGGEPDHSVTSNLNALNQRAGSVGAPWELSFSFGRSLQGEPLKAWAGKAENTEAAAMAFYTRARLTGAARRGNYTPEG
jgi:fructose-bisphosphate aldolase class I